MSKACLVDTTRCIGCRACQVACKQWNELPQEKTTLRGTGGGYENPPALSSKTYTQITFHEIVGPDGQLQRSVFVKRQCMHCAEPACVSACPVAALEKVQHNGQATGPVMYHAAKCIGCRYCMMACPFDVPTLEWDRLAPRIQQCTFCADRQQEPPSEATEVNDTPLRDTSLQRFQNDQRTPACVKACPTEAIKFGEREELIREARDRIEKHNRKPGSSWRYQPDIYGEKEIGGTAWMYVSNVPFKELNFRTDLGETPYPEYTRLALEAVPPAVLGFGTALGGLYWFAHRRDDVRAESERRKAEGLPSKEQRHVLHEQAKGKFLTLGTAVLLLLMAAGAIAAVLRFSQGLGATTNLSDSYPWGLWVAVDVMAGVALAAGGFATAALVYLFGRQKYHALVRPAVLTGLLGYVFVAVGLLFDLALPWNIWHPIIMWPEGSAMFEVAWCVMLYLAVLALEFVPAVCQRFEWPGLESLWRRISPILSVAALGFFVGIMAHSWIWAAVALILFAALAAILPATVRSRPGVPVLLIIAGVVLSTMHQSSLGTLFLQTPHRLDPLWWTPSLPINFFLSAVAVGFAMVIFEATLSARAFRRPVEKEALAGLEGILAYSLWIYLAYRLIDLAARGNLAGVIGGERSALFLLEMVVGVLIPALILALAKLRRNTAGPFVAATLVVLGVVLNRINVAWLATTAPGEDFYVPSFLELTITVSIIAAIVFCFTLTVRTFPVFARAEESP